MLALLAAFVAALAGALAGAPDVPLHFFFENRNESLEVSLLDRSGAVATDALAELSHFVRCVRTDRERPIHPRLAEIVARTAAAFERRRVEVVSGYRAAPYGAPHSKHFVGRAMDLKLSGVPARKVAAWVWHNFRGVGVGLYPVQGFVHIDVRDVDVRWLDLARHGESGSVHYSSRGRDDVRPGTAPQLDYDVRPGAIDRPYASKEKVGIRGSD